MTRICAAGKTIEGFDISHWQPDVDFNQAKSAGFQFVFIKATDGETGHDVAFKAHWVAAKAANLVRGAYHFFRPEEDPLVQAQNLVKTVGPLSHGDCLIMDWEADDNVGALVDFQKGYACLNEIKRLSGVNPICYSGPNFMSGLGVHPELAAFPLWVANYTTLCPAVPVPWRYWSIWQWTSTAKILAVGKGAEKVDLNLFNGTIDQLVALGAP